MSLGGLFGIHCCLGKQSWLFLSGHGGEAVVEDEEGKGTEGKPLLKMKRALAANGIHQEAYTGDSFWIGTATTAASVGLEKLSIQLLGRWNSVAFLAFISTPGAQLA